MWAMRTSENPMDFCRTTWHCNPEDYILQTDCSLILSRGNYEYYTMGSSWKWILFDPEYSYLQVITVFTGIHSRLDCSHPVKIQ
jgi:hypothetical protein